MIGLVFYVFRLAFRFASFVKSKGALDLCSLIIFMGESLRFSQFVMFLLEFRCRMRELVMKYMAEKVYHDEMVKMPLVDLKVLEDGSFRICMDYRKLSEIAIRDHCHQMRVPEEEIPKTDFRTRYGYIEFTVMPFGLTKAPTVFMELMSQAWWFYLRMLEALGVRDEECDIDRSRASTTHFQSEGLNMRQRRWMELFSDYGYETKYHMGKANIVVDAWRKKGGVKPRRV
nr:hypothetical protein [Tanacetum cinerariifolium]